MKRYVTIPEAIAYVQQQTLEPVSERDLIDCARRGEIKLCFYERISFAAFEMGGGENAFEVRRPPGWWHIEGYFSIQPGSLAGMKIPSSVRYVDCYEALASNDEPDPDTLAALASDEWIILSACSFARSDGKQLPVLRDIDIDADELLIPLRTLEALIEKKKNKEKSVDSGKNDLQRRERTTLLNIIAALVELIQTPKAKEERDSETKVIAELVKNYSEKQGIAKRTLEQKFAEAKNSLQNA